MAAKQQTALDETLKFILTYGCYMAYIVVGLIGKYGWDIINHRKMTWGYFFGTAAVGIFVGFIVSTWCVSHAPQSAAFVVPTATLMSRDVMLFLNMIDWQGVLKLITKKNTTENKENI